MREMVENDVKFPQLPIATKIVAVEQDNHSFADIKRIDDQGKDFLKELEEFFVNYHRLSGEAYKILGTKGPARADKRLKQAMNNK
jgi:inorganic pyrophosphatase